MKKIQTSKKQPSNGTIYIICGKVTGLTSWIGSFVDAILLFDNWDMVGFESVFIDLYVLSRIFILRERPDVVKCNTSTEEKFPLNFVCHQYKIQSST